jgi:hypothetical protein
MVYPANREYLRFRGAPIKGETPSNASRSIDFLRAEEEDKVHLRDHPSITETQDVYKALEPEE